MGIRSELVIHDVEAASGMVILATEAHIEAPNWSPCGKYLLVNGGGRLFRVPLDAPALIEVDTGFAKGLNNDHGISPDGTEFVFSDKVETGMSCIYRMSVAGGAPVRVSKQVPSYYHGWSPDGARLAYCCRRDGVFGVATSAVDGADETLLTDGRGHSDGPDYTPDGAWIWFNSSQGGTMQLWRCRPDGSDMEQMTADDRVNWFPHPSPDGSRVLYLAYPSGTENHPPDLDVELRFIAPEGGMPETIVTLFGGQGTINVPCWEPGGARFAYMRYYPK